MSIISNHSKIVRTSGIKIPASRPSDAVHHRQTLIPGFTDALRRSRGCLVGAGGLGSAIAEALVRMGLSALTCWDKDVYEPSNLSRVGLAKDLWKNKAHCLVENLSPHCTTPAVLTGYDLHFQDALALGFDFGQFDFFVCAVDNDTTRAIVSQHFRSLKIPGIHMGLGIDALNGYVFVETMRPDEPCFGCIHPNCLRTEPAPCFVASSREVVLVTAGYAVFGVNTLLMPERKRQWNFRFFTLPHFIRDVASNRTKNPNCPLCCTR